MLLKDLLKNKFIKKNRSSQVNTLSIPPFFWIVENEILWFKFSNY